MPGIEFASDRLGSFPEFKMADGGEGEITFIKTF